MTSIRKFTQHARDDKAFVLPMFAIFLTVLIGFIGFGVDITAWYMRANKIQRAADAASLAAAAEMPDTAAATAAALATTEKNGFVDGVNDVAVTYTPLPPNQFAVNIQDNSVQSLFARMVMDHITIGRTSTAEFLSSVPMGSPFSVLGTGGLATGSTVPVQNFWLAVNGYCTSKEDGDLFLSRWDGNREPAPASSVFCPPSANVELNTDYNPEGYNFIVEVPKGYGGTVQAEIYDAAYSGGVVGAPDEFNKTNAATAPEATITTIYTLWDTNYTDDKSDDTQLLQNSFVTNDPFPKAVNDWWRMTPPLKNTDPLRPHKYRIQVQTLANEMGSWGANAFGIRAVHNGLTKACDTRTDTSCPSVYAENAMSVLANLNPSGGSSAHKVNFYLASIDPGYTGSPMTVSLWDPGDPGVAGETGKTISLIAPDKTKPAFYWSAVPACCGYSGYDTALDVSGLGTQPSPASSRFGTAKFNDRRVDLTQQLPSTYPSMVSGAGSDWWQIEYSLPASAAPRDRATWSVTITGSDPVHLVRN